MIHSRDVPFFRDERLELLERPFVVSIITAPGPMPVRRCGAMPRADPRFARRCGAGRASCWRCASIEGTARSCWAPGACGVFRNEPAEVAEAFAGWLEGPRFGRSFERVVFAVWDRTRERTTQAAFERRLAARPSP